tara:strand:- start:495 stop:1046 length:552 start_codon:yes stop_codon:yes gene_type:complete
MSTRSYIAVEQPNKQVHSIYCHFDGYLEGVGNHLLKYWNSEELANKLISFGDISSVPSSTDEIEMSEQAYDNENGKASEHATEYHMITGLNGDIFIEYIYIWKDESWHYSKLVMIHNIENAYDGHTSFHTKFKKLCLKDIHLDENFNEKTYCEECPEETSGFYLCDDCEEEQFNKDEEENNRD